MSVRCCPSAAPADSDLLHIKVLPRSAACESVRASIKMPAHENPAGFIDLGRPQACFGEHILWRDPSRKPDEQPRLDELGGELSRLGLET